MREGYAVALDGAPIYYRVLGRQEANAPALVLCDGIGCDGYVWKYLVPALEADYKLVHWHYRGHGRTPVPRDRKRLGIPDLADDLVEVMNAVDVPRAAFFGHSMGVQVCLEGFRRHHDRVTALCLMCGSYGHPLRTFKGRRTLDDVLPWVSFAVSRVPRLAASFLRTAVPTTLAYAIATRTEINGELVHIDDFMPYLEHIGNLEPTLFLGMLANAGRHSAKEVLPAIDVPTLVVAGARDGFTPAWLSEEMCRRIPGAQMLMIEDGSHTAPIERPDLVCRTIRTFLEERVLPSTSLRRAG
jgi:pimeloyl-ACP methyl ester carboxylesterase